MDIDRDFMITMQPEIKAKWLEELRSGNRKQGVGFLQTDDNCFCCLGVLSDLAAQDSIVEKELMSSGSFAFGAAREYVGLPEEVMSWANIVMENTDNTRFGRLPFRRRGGRPVYLDDLNDEGMSFDQIADVIEYWY